MIGWIEGTVLSDDGVVATSAGVGYQISVSSPVTVGEPVELWVITLVRETAITLYGFRERVEQDLFRALIKTAGVGPAVTIAAMRVLGWQTLAAAIAREDLQVLCTVPGVGPSVAKKLVSANIPDTVHAAAAPSGPEPGGGAGPAGATSELIAALAGLGFDRDAARDALAAAAADGVVGDAALMHTAMQGLTRGAR